jgi:hypothetical protein
MNANIQIWWVEFGEKHEYYVSSEVAEGIRRAVGTDEVVSFTTVRNNKVTVRMDTVKIVMVTAVKSS